MRAKQHPIKVASRNTIKELRRQNARKARKRPDFDEGGQSHRTYLKQRLNTRQETICT